LAFVSVGWRLNGFGALEDSGGYPEDETDDAINGLLVSFLDVEVVPKPNAIDPFSVTPLDFASLV
jgi:hypothetical protein